MKIWGVPGLIQFQYIQKLRYRHKNLELEIKSRIKKNLKRQITVFRLCCPITLNFYKSKLNYCNTLKFSKEFHGIIRFTCLKCFLHFCFFNSLEIIVPNKSHTKDDASRLYSRKLFVTPSYTGNELAICMWFIRGLQVRS